MIVLRTIYNGVAAHAGIRFTEWVGAFPLVGLGLILHHQPDVLQQSASFSVLTQWATQETWVLILLTIGLMRVCALIINGSFPRWFRQSPLIRHCVSLISLIFWTLMWNGVYLAWKDAGGLPTAIVMYALPILLEFRNVYVSRYDMVIMKARG